MAVALIHCGYSCLPKTYTKPGQLKIPTRGGESTDVPPIAEELESLDDCWRRETLFFMWWRGIDRILLPMCLRTDTNWTQWVIKND